MSKTLQLSDIKELLLELRDITILAMAQSGVRKSSDLSKSVQYIATKDGIQMKVNEYYPFVSDGRSTTNRPARVSKVPIDALIEWIKAKGISPRPKQTTNQLAFAIQTAIYNRGLNTKRPVKGKNFGDNVANNVGDYAAEKMVDYAANFIADSVEEALEVV